MTSRFTVTVEQGYVKVRRNGETICAALDTASKLLRDIEFTQPKHQKCNKTRQAAMIALQKAGYR